MDKNYFTHNLDSESLHLASISNQLIKKYLDYSNMKLIIGSSQE